MTEETAKPPVISRKSMLALAGAALFAAGAGSAFLVGATRPAAVMALIRPVAIGALAEGNDIVTVRGKVTQTYTNNFIVTDTSGKVLVEAGRGWRATPLVAVGQDVSVQGRFAEGRLRAQYLVGADGKVVALRGGRGGHEGKRQREDRFAAMPVVPGDQLSATNATAISPR